MPPSFDKPHVPSGVTEACLMNDHTMCSNPRCSCSCHRPEVNPNIPAPSPVEQLEKACPQCGSKQPGKENYCRIDGHRLASLLCAICGKGMNPEDGYCWNCGAPKGTKGDVVNVPQVVVTPPIEGEIDYARQVLEGVQRELEGGNGNVQPTEGQRVVEEVGGVQGRFKLVNVPNPNKVRVPSKPIQPGPPAIPRTLPVKP